VTISGFVDGYDRLAPNPVWNLVPWSLFNGTWNFPLRPDCSGQQPDGQYPIHHIEEVDVAAYAATLGIPGFIDGVFTGYIGIFMTLKVTLQCRNGAWTLVLDVGFNTVCSVQYVSDAKLDGTNYPSGSWTLGPASEVGLGCGPNLPSPPTIATVVS
jgi:hypothetical protein